MGLSQHAWWWIRHGRRFAGCEVGMLSVGYGWYEGFGRGDKEVGRLID